MTARRATLAAIIVSHCDCPPKKLLDPFTFSFQDLICRLYRKSTRLENIYSSEGRLQPWIMFSETLKMEPLLSTTGLSSLQVTEQMFRQKLPTLRSLAVPMAL